MLRFTNYLAPLALSIAVVASACNKQDKSANALGQDTTLNRDLQLANRDTTSQPQLSDVPAAPADTAAPATPVPAAVPAPVAAPQKPTPTATPRRTRKPTAPSSASAPPAQPAEPTTTASGNSVSTSASGSESALGEIPAGSVINLTSNDKVCTNTNKAGDRFTATVTDAVVGSNGAVIPAGSKVVMQVSDLKHSGNTNQDIQMTFAVLNVAINGKSYPLSADIDHVDVNQVRNASAKSDAAKVAGGAVVGAILGQIIGHNTKGTVIGAATGAAAGTAVAMGTAAYEGCVPTGGKIAMHLLSPATVAVR
jgi:hypothetical protein